MCSAKRHGVTKQQQQQNGEDMQASEQHIMATTTLSYLQDALDWPYPRLILILPAKGKAVIQIYPPANPPVLTEGLELEVSRFPRRTDVSHGPNGR